MKKTLINCRWWSAFPDDFKFAINMLKRTIITKKWTTGMITMVILMTVTGCKKEELTDFECSHAVEKRNNRTIAYAILDATEKGDFDMNYEIASSQLKSEFIQLLQPWNAFENNTEGVYDGEAMQFYDILNDFASSSGTKLSLIIATIDIPGRFLPDYLGNKKLNDPLVIESFNNLIDKLFNPTNGVVNPDHVIALSVGNEIDHYDWAVNNDNLSEYKDFLRAIKSKINSYNIPLHFTGTLYGMKQSSNTWTELVNAVDKLSITYYPLNSDFTVKVPDVVYSDFDAFLSKFSDKAIFVQEIGYPSSMTLNSNELKQAEFFCHFFNAWDTFKEQVSHVSILRLNDVSLDSAEATAINYGIPSNKNFIEYIRTLGIRTWNDTGDNKKAYELIVNELNRRDW